MSAFYAYTKSKWYAKIDYSTPKLFNLVLTREVSSCAHPPECAALLWLRFAVPRRSCFAFIYLADCPPWVKSEPRLAGGCRGCMEHPLVVELQHGACSDEVPDSEPRSYSDCLLQRVRRSLSYASSHCCSGKAIHAQAPGFDPWRES